MSGTQGRTVFGAIGDRTRRNRFAHSVFALLLASTAAEANPQTGNQSATGSECLAIGQPSNDEIRQRIVQIIYGLTGEHAHQADDVPLCEDSTIGLPITFVTYGMKGMVAFNRARMIAYLDTPSTDDLSSTLELSRTAYLSTMINQISSLDQLKEIEMASEGFAGTTAALVGVKRSQLEYYIKNMIPQGSDTMDTLNQRAYMLRRGFEQVDAKPASVQNLAPKPPKSPEPPLLVRVWRLITSSFLALMAAIGTIAAGMGAIYKFRKWITSKIKRRRSRVRTSGDLR